MKPGVGHHGVPLLLLMAALLLRAGTPDGYMPAAAGTGLLYELCPSGVSAEFMQFLGGGDHHHHGGDAEPVTHVDADQCPIGHMLSPVMAAEVDALADIAAAPEVPIPAPAVVSLSRSVATHRSRGPPA